VHCHQLLLAREECLLGTFGEVGASLRQLQMLGAAVGVAFAAPQQSAGGEFVQPDGHAGRRHLQFLGQLAQRGAQPLVDELKNGELDLAADLNGA
jgi:hypothetical protein